MERIKRKDLKKQDEFVDTSFRLLRVIEEHPKFLLGGVGALLAIVIIVTGGMTLIKSRSNATADEFSRAQAAQVGFIALDGNPEPADPYNPSFESAEQRTEVALDRLKAAAGGTGISADLAGYLAGVTLLESGDTNAALEQLESSVAALGADPTLGGGVKEVYALALEQSGAMDKALVVWQELAAEDSTHPRDLGLFGLARVQLALGDSEAAHAAYQEIVDLFPQSAVVGKAREALDR